MDRVSQYRIHSSENGFDRPSRVAQVRGQVLPRRVVVPGRLKNIQVMPHRVVEPGECTVVKEGRLYRDVANRRRSELIAVVGIVCYILPAKVFIEPRPVKGIVGIERRYLRNPDNVIFKVAEHLVRLAGYLMALDTARLSKEEQRAFLLVLGHGITVAAGEPVNGRIGKRQ